MQIRQRSRRRGIPLFVLVGLLLAGILLHFPLSPERGLMDVVDIGLPLSIVGVLLVSVFLIQFHDASDLLRSRCGRFGCLGALVGGLIGIWLASYHLSHGMPITHTYDEVLTVLSIGSVAGALVGISTAFNQWGVSSHQNEREYVVAESTWTNRSGPNPIAMELIEQLADLEQVDPVDLEPLAHYVDVDTFPKLRAAGGRPWQVCFYTDDYEIRVSSHGTITVYGIHRPDASPAISPTPSTP